MRRFFGILLVAFTLMSVSGLAAQQATPEATDTVSPLQVVESSPEPGQELGLNSPIVIYFDRAVDCSTVESAATISPKAEGSFACDGPNAKLTFTPSAAYQTGTTYTVTVPAGVRGADGSTLADDFSMTLNTTGALAVSQVLPADGSDGDEPSSVITVIFNRPVVPLGVAEDASTLPQPLTISPDIKGHGEWLNTSIYVFHADPALAGGVKYTVTVKAGLKAVDGATLPSDYSWSFSTLPPGVVSTDPLGAATDIPLDQALTFTFNQPMDQASVEAGFALHRTDERSQNVPGNFTWSDDGTAVTFKPDANLLLDLPYQASIDGNTAKALGGAPLKGGADLSFTTVPAPSILSTDPYDGQTDVDPQTSFTIQFASSMDQGTLNDKVTIDPKPWRDPDYYYSDYNNSLNVSFPVEPSTDYTVTIAAGMKDVYGNTIDKPTTVKFTTAPYAGDIMLQTPGQIGFYNAHNDKTQLFLTHRNVDRLDLDLYGVSLDTFGHILTDGNQYDDLNNFQPDGSDLLRTWSIDTSKTGLNQSRYELLDVGAQSDGSASCPGAPVSRLKVGDSAIVLTSDPLRARASAPDGDVVTRLYKDYALPITGGPTCANGLVWWQVTLRGGASAWVAEGDTTEYYIGLKSASAETEVDVTAEATAAPESTSAPDATPEATDEPAHPLAPGVYALDVTSPEFGFTQPQQHLMVVGTANLTMKLSIDSALIWATDVSSGEPVANAPVTIYGENFEQLGSGTTDADGLVTIKTPRASDLYAPRVAVLQSDDQFGITSSDWSDGIEPYSFNQNFDSSPQQYRIYLYSDRPIYRPGQPVYFRGVARERNDVTYTQPPFKTVKVTIQNENGDQVYNEELPLTPFGTFSGQFDIGADASLGNYRIMAQDPSQTDDSQNYYYTDSGMLSFDVAEYRAPEFQVNVTPDKDEVVQGDTIKALVDSKYFFGGNVSNAQVEYHVTNQPFYFSYTGQGNYSFQDFDYDAGPGSYAGSVGEEVASGTGTTDANGQYLISIPADLKDATQSQTWTVEATVTDESGQAVSGRSDVTVHKGELYVGVAPDDYVGLAKQEMKVNLITVGWDSKAIANQPVDVKVVERRWSNVQEQDDSGRSTWTWQVEDIPVTTSSVTTGADGKAVYSFTPPNGGIFKITASSHDARGNEVIASDTIWVSSDTYVSWRQDNSNRIDLIADKDKYQVGDDATILIASPFQGKAEALVTVERGEVLKTERITLNTNSYVYHLPITAEDAPNVFVSVVIVKGVDANNPVAAFRMGLVQLAVDNQQKELHLQITPDKEQAGPGDTVNYTVTATDYKGDPVVAEVGVGLTDLATLSIADANSSPILGFYYGAQGLSVRTATPLTINTDQLTQTTLDTVKGGGGGFGEGGIFDIRQNFVDTAYWNATLTTGADGKATFSVKLPDNLTTWRLDARAVTSGEDGLTLVGQNTLDLISTKPLLIRPVTPRFFVVGDTASVAAVVNNNTDAEQKVDVTLQAKGVTFQSDATQSITIPAGGRQRVDWKVTVSDVDNVDFTFYANGNNGAYTDASKPPLGQGDDRLLPVYKYEVPETVGTAGLIRTGGDVTEAISLPRSYDVTQGELDVNLQPSLAASTVQSLDYLQNYPYQCLEQTVSRFLPNVMTYRALSGLGLDNPTLKTNLDTNVNTALQKLYAEQHVDGGWGWFIEDDSNPLTTAYALIGLAEAKAQGFAVSDDTLSNAQKYLKTQFIAPGSNQPAWRLNRQAFILYALARSGAPDASRTATLYASRERLDYYARAFMALTFHTIDPTDTSRSDVLLSDLMNAAVVSATGTHWNEPEQDYWNWNTDTRTTAIALEAFVTLQPKSDLIPNIVRYLMVERKADAWETTQETAWAVMSLTDWMVASGELKPDYTYAASLNGVPLTANASATSANVTESNSLTVQVGDLLKDQANKLVISRSDGDGILYYTAHLKVNLPVDQVQPLDRGIIVDRRYTIGSSDAPVTSAKVGDLVTVRLTVIAPNDLHYVVIEDPIPAGTDAVNPDLKTSQQVGTQPELNLADPLSQGWGWWYFSNIEFRDQKVVLFSTYLPAGTYEYVYTLRAGLAGTFNVIPATGQEFYFPEVYGRSAGSTFTIADAAQ